MQIHQQQYDKSAEEILNLFLELAEKGEQPKIFSKLKTQLRKAKQSLEKMEKLNDNENIKLKIWHQQCDVEKTIQEIYQMNSDSEEEEEHVYVGTRVQLINMLTILITIVIIGSFC